MEIQYKYDSFYTLKPAYKDHLVDRWRDDPGLYIGEVLQSTKQGMEWMTASGEVFFLYYNLTRPHQAVMTRWG